MKIVGLVCGFFALSAVIGYTNAGKKILKENSVKWKFENILTWIGFTNPPPGFTFQMKLRGLVYCATQTSVL